MKKDVLPPVIENLLKSSSDIVEAMEDYEMDGELVNDLRESLIAARQYKQQLERDDLISLFVVSTGEPENGIKPEQIEIKIPRVYIQPDSLEKNYPGIISLREEVKNLFSDACSTLFETAVGRVAFEDE